MASTTQAPQQVAQLYTALFGRAPDFDGLVFWVGTMARGQSFVDVANTMFATAPARAYYPDFLSDQGIIASFYRNVLGREADSQGLAFWTGKLNAAGATPGAVIAELIGTVANYAGVAPAGLASQQLFNNKVAVAQHYAQAGGGIAGATAILSTITADVASALAAIAAIDAGIDPPAGTDTAAPVFATASVNGISLVLTYTDPNALDAAHPPPASAFVVDVAGTARAVTAVAVDATAKTVTLTLASAVAYGQAVTLAYTDPTSANDDNAIQDSAGNDAASLAGQAVANTTADTAPPVFTGATVTGATLVLSYAEQGALDAAHLPAASAFKVVVAGASRAVTAVAIDPAAKTVTLTLASAVTQGQAVTVAYTDPGSGNDAAAIQDAAGNDAATLGATAVTNDTAATESAPPVFAGATVSATTLVMGYTDQNALDAGHAPAASAFKVMVAGVSRTVTAVAVDADSKTVTLTLVSAVTQEQVVTVAYTDPTSGNDTNALQDAEGNDAASLAATAVTNITADTTRPVFAGATVNGATLVMGYADLGTLDAAHLPSAGAFKVMVAGVARAVSSVACDADAKTVLLTLASPVTQGQAVTVAYTDPSSANDANAIQDAAGNDAATLGATAVANVTVAAETTAPVFAGASVNGATLVMNYTEQNTLDAAHPPAASAFRVTVAGSIRTVSSVAVDADAKTVTLTLSSAVAQGQTVTVAYTDPTSGNDTNALQDAEGNDAATLAATAVANNTPDATAPVFASGAVNGATLVMNYTDLNALDAAHAPAPGAFTVMVAGAVRGVDSVAVDAAAKTVTLTLASAVANRQTVTVAYTDPTSGNDANAIQDAAGNDAASLGARMVTNNTPDSTAPVFASAKVTGSALVMAYTDLNTLDPSHVPATGAFKVTVAGVVRSVNAVAVDASAKTVTLTLASAVASGQSVTVAYTDPSGGNDANAIQDAAGNDAASLPATVVTNNTPADTTAPVFANATVDGDVLVMTYAELNLLDDAHLPLASAFDVTVAGDECAVEAVAIDAAAKTVVLTLATAVTAGQAVTLAYTDPSGSNDLNAIQDAAGNDAASFAATPVANGTAAAMPALHVVGIAFLAPAWDV